ncbi:MAG: cysteine desulfurase [Erysipelotrichaceae bacterium]|nr:cysteine desulfurase [Erysipelotrichaceae bacterium]
MFDINRIRKDFPMFENNPELVYLDNAATSFKPQCVIDAVTGFYTRYTSNIHRGDYDISYKVSKEYEDTRKTVAELINAEDPLDIVFTSGASEGLNLVAYGYGLRHLRKGDVILLTLSEHASDILPWFDVAKKTGARIEYIPLKGSGMFDLEAYSKLLEENDVKIVALPYVSNVLGYINPIKDICTLAHKKGAIVSVDGAQGVPHLKIDVRADGIDLMSFSSHKMLGPSGVGVLYGKKEILEKIDPLKMGGGANARFNKEGEIILKEIPARFEAGTPNIEGVLGLKKACEYLMGLGMENVEAHDRELTEYMEKRLSQLPDVHIYNKGSQCSIIAFNVEGIFAQDVGSYLNSLHIAVRTGNHCAKVLHNVIGATETVRASVYLYNSREDIDALYDALKDITLEKCIGALI